MWLTNGLNTSISARMYLYLTPNGAWFAPALAICLYSFHSEEVYEPVQIQLEIIKINTNESEQIPLLPWTQIIDQSHVLYIVLVMRVCYICLRVEIEQFNQTDMCFITIMNNCEFRLDMVFQCLLNTWWCCFPWPYIFA